MISNCIQLIKINKNNIKEVEELDVRIGDTFQLGTKANNDLSANVIWESSNPEVVSIDENGNVVVLQKGPAVVTATVQGKPYITDSIFVDSAAPVEQLGVGSGLTANDPIFLGNEGDEEPIEIYFNEMQQIYGDSIFIKKGNVEVLIDAGYEYDGKHIEKLVTEKVADDRLDLLMLSHSDGDHINGLVNALVNIDDVSLMVDYGGVGTGNTLKTRNKYKEKGMAYYSAYDCINELNGASKRYYLTSELYFDVLNTGNYIKNTESSAGNGKSLAVIFTYKDFTFFTGGDLTTSSEQDLLKLEDLPEVTLFKAGHHGSNTSTSTKLLEVIKPNIVVVTAVAGSVEYTQNLFNTFPTSNVLNRVKDYTDKVYVTSQATIELVNDKYETTGFSSLNGNIVVTSNKNGVEVKDVIEILKRNIKMKHKSKHCFLLCRD